MPFTFKLSQRLARMRCMAVMLATAALAACERPMKLTDAGTSVSQLVVSPRAVTLRTDQVVDLMAVGFTSAGDTAVVSVSWSVTSGSVINTSTSGGRHYSKFKAGSDTGKVKVIAHGQPGGTTDTAVVTVTAVPVSAVTVSPATASLVAGATQQLAATTLDSAGGTLSGRTITWTSGNPGVATISGTGLVTAVTAGSATVTAMSEGKSGAATIVVTSPPPPPPPPVASVSVSPASASVSVGGTQQFTATLRDASGSVITGRTINWTSSPVNVATVSASGLATALLAGTATVTATSEGKSGTATIVVTTPPPPPPPPPVASVTVSPASASVTVGGTQQFTATLRDASGAVLSGRPISWTSSPVNVASVSGSGLVTTLVAGTATITATSEGQSGSATVTVTAVPPPSSTGWTNQPAGVTTVSDQPWDGLTTLGWNSIYNTNGYVSIVNDATAPLSPGNVIQFRYPSGFAAGSAPGTEWLGLPSLTRAYVGLWWKASNPWQGNPTGVNKIEYLFSNSQGSIFLCMYGPPGGPYELRVFPQFNVSQDVWLVPNVNQVAVTLGQWHKIEWLVDYNGGVVKWWLDGQLIGSYTGVPMPSSALVEYHLTPVWGGVDGVKSQTDYYWYDHIRISGN